MSESPDANRCSAFFIYTPATVCFYPMFSNNDADIVPGKTFASQDKLPKLPVPPLEETCRRYLRALEGLQDPEEHTKTKEVVREFLENEGPEIQQKLMDWARTRDRYTLIALDRIGSVLIPIIWLVDSYIEEFWYIFHIFECIWCSKTHCISGTNRIYRTVTQ